MSALRKIAVNEKQCTLYDVASGQTLTETALLDVIAKRDAYPKLVEALRKTLLLADVQRGMLKFDATPTETDAIALLRELGEDA